MPQKKKTRILYAWAFLYNRDAFYNSMWITKYVCKLMVKGQKHLIEKYTNAAFITLKFLFKKLPGYIFLERLVRFLPVFSYVNKRMGRKFNSVPIPIKERRQHILSMNYIVKHTQNVVNRDLNTRIATALTEIFGAKKNSVTKKIAEEVKHLTDSRIYLHLRWK